MAKIAMKTPLVEIDGDEMTRVLWQIIKETLIAPFVDLKTEYYDLGLANRDATDDAVSSAAARAIQKYGVGVKCATITPNAARKEEYHLKKIYPSPNATIRAILDGTVFRKPIQLNCIKPSVVTWKKPIVIGRHAYGDIYKSVELAIDGPGVVELVWTPQGGGDEKRKLVADMKGGGIVMGMHNYDDSIYSFARSCFRFALNEKIDLWFASKDTISQIYDARFKAIFNAVFNDEYKNLFDKVGIRYFYTLIDDAVARMVKSEGGFLWACKNYDGDVMSDLIASASGSLAMMTSALVSPSGVFEFEAAHGTVQQHYYRYQKGEKTSTNPVALIFAWTGALAKRGDADNNSALCDFAAQLEAATLATIENGKMTADLAALANLPRKESLDSLSFINAVASAL